MALTAAERRALIRKRLAESQEPAGTVEETTNTFTEPVADETETVDEPIEETSEPLRKRKVSRVPSQLTNRRINKPPNYKLHVLTALSLAVAIRIARYGSKAITG